MDSSEHAVLGSAVLASYGTEGLQSRFAIRLVKSLLNPIVPDPNGEAPNLWVGYLQHQEILI